jgi:4-amino-4-deoxy-L-arabinose transferase-like glycosyltransferase
VLPSDPGPLTRRERQLLVAALVIGLASYSYGLFRYPLYLTDEGIYVQRAWAVLREAQLSPYTYFYDHAPGGWLALAGWVGVLPGHFEAFGNPINTGRVLMVPLHLGSVYLLFDIARRFSGGVVAGFVATLLFNLSPLGIFYQRQVLLDNFMVFWLLLGVYLVIRCDRRVVAALAGGLCFGLAVVTKENAIFFGPVLAFLLYQRTRHNRSRRFSKGFWFFAGGTPVAFYAMYAVLKGELLPTGLDFDLNNPPSDRVSLAYTVWWQLNRTTPGSPVSGNSMFWQMMRDFWLPKDTFLLAAGGLATMILLVQGLRDWRRNQAELAAAVLALSYAVYMMRGSVLLEFYVIPLVPLLALNIGLVFAALVRRLPRMATVAVVGATVAVLATPAGGYVLVHGDTGRLQVHDMYRLHLTSMQVKQMDWVLAHVPAKSRMIIDDDMWTTLRDADPPYRFAHSHWEASADPAVRDKVFHQDWRNIDYIVMSNKMRQAMVRNNSDGREDWILDALDNHAQRVWNIRQGDVELSVYRVG